MPVWLYAEMRTALVVSWVPSTDECEIQWRCGSAPVFFGVAFGSERPRCPAADRVCVLVWPHEISGTAVGFTRRVDGVGDQPDARDRRLAAVARSQSGWHLHGDRSGTAVAGERTAGRLDGAGRRRWVRRRRRQGLARLRPGTARARHDGPQPQPGGRQVRLVQEPRRGRRATTADPVRGARRRSTAIASTCSPKRGDLWCLREDGTEVWHRNILSDFSGSNIQWLLSESPLVDGDRVIVTPGGRDAGIVALDKMTGKTIWTAKELSDDAGYSSAVVVDVEGMRAYTTFTAVGRRRRARERRQGDVALPRRPPTAPPTSRRRSCTRTRCSTRPTTAPAAGW